MYRTKVFLLALSETTYLIFSLFTLHKKSDDFFSAAEKIKNHQHITVNQLKEKFNAEEFNGNMKNIIGKNLIIDTTLISLYQKFNSYFIKAKINSSFNKNYFVKLKCNKKIYELATKSKTNHLTLVAKIIESDKAKINFLTDTIDGKKELYSEDYFILTGECLSINESKYL